MIIRRGAIYLAALDPTLGHEIAKTRPALVVSNDKNNRFAGTVTVLPITSGALEKVYPFEVGIPRGEGGLPKASKIKADQIRTIDKKRLIKAIGALSDEHMSAVDRAVRIHLDLD
jgi:mRNA interferase MazF